MDCICDLFRRADMDWIWDLFGKLPRDRQDAHHGADMDWIWDLFRRLPRDIQDAVSFPSGRSDYEDFALPPAKGTKSAACSSTAAAPEDTLTPQLKKINDYVYEIHNPSRKRPSIELVFFHGLELKGTPTSHVTSWLSRDGSELWLNWIVKVLPEARILSVSYDAHSRRTHEHGHTDMYVTTENLLQCLTDVGAEVGQDGCPVVLVGHCLGGLVMKELCFKAHSEFGLLSSERLKNLLSNIKGLFFYASPHHGTKLAEMRTQFIKGTLFEDVATLNTEAERRNEHFRKLRQKYKWRSFGIGESHEVTLGSFTGLVVAEASARYDVDGFYTDLADHFNVSRPHSTTSSSFRLFMSFVTGLLKEDKARCGPKISFPDEVVGLDEQVIKVQRILKGARHVGIVGMGGLGKTTLAKTLYDNISGNFEYTCFLEDVRTNMHEKRNIHELQSKIIESLFYKGYKVDKEFEWCTLKRKKVLIILDDVDAKSQIRVLMKADEFKDESHIIVTSRDRRFLEQENFTLYTMALLDNDNSKQLFCINTFKDGIPISGYEDRIARFTQKCEGLPLALQVTGRYLNNRSEKVWDDALDRLSNAKALDGNVEDGLWSILRVSYDSLQEEEKQMFLDIATCYHGEKLDEVKEAWKICNPTFDECGWDNLLDKGLVTEVELWDGKIIHMHEILRDLGRSIACPDPQNFSNQSRVSYDYRVSEVEPWSGSHFIHMHEVLCNLGRRIAHPNPQNLSSHIRLSHDSRVKSGPFHQEKPSVKVLKINLNQQYHFYNEHERQETSPSSSISIGAMREFDDLRAFWLNGGNLYGACQLFPRNLLCVKIKMIDSWVDSSIDESFPEELEQNRTLRYLEIRYSGLKTLPSSLWQLQGLQHLTINECNQLKALPDSFGELQALKTLRIMFCRNVSLPDTLGLLQALEKLTIIHCQNLSLPSSLGKLQALKHLLIRACHNLGVLEVILGQLQALEHLEIEHKSLDILSNVLGQLQALKHLSLAGLDLEDFLPESLVRIRGLEYLSIRANYLADSFGDYSLESLPDTFGELRALKHLELEGCHGLQALPETLGQLQALEVLKIDDCEGLEVLPNTLGRLKSLKRLKLKIENGLLKSIPDTLGELERLEYLYIKASVLEALPSTLGQLQALTHLELDCWILGSLPDTIGQLQALKHLVVTSGGLKALPGTLGGLQALEELHLWSCSELKALPDTFGLLHALKILYIENCGHIEALPVTLGHLQSLEELRISYCPSLRALPDTLGQLESLEHLTIRHCDNLEDLPESLKQILGRLKHVDLQGSSKIEEILQPIRRSSLRRTR